MPNNLLLNSSDRSLMKIFQIYGMLTRDCLQLESLVITMLAAYFTRSQLESLLTKSLIFKVKIQNMKTN
jgi:hypothetical protein